MATGTTGGLLDTAKATSVFKHEILRQYVPPYVAKVGSTAAGNRVMLVDGFAGRGRFDDGTKASAEYFLAAARDLTRAKASVRLFEVNAADAARLADLVAEYRAVNVDATSECADIRDRIDAVIDEAAGIPLFILLDPCGQNLPYATLVRILRDRRPGQRPSTEVLLNLSADFTRRIGGTLHAGHIDAKGLTTMDTMMGGDWWRDLALEVHANTPDRTWGAAADAVALEYTQRLANEAKMGGAVTPVRRKPENQPTYHLAYLTRNNEGLWVMAAAIARGRQKWCSSSTAPRPTTPKAPSSTSTPSPTSSQISRRRAHAGSARGYASSSNMASPSPWSTMPSTCSVRTTARSPSRP